jgi:hypothetical protein
VDEIMQLHIARQDGGCRLLDDSSSPDDDSRMELSETSSAKPPFATITTSKESVGKKSREKSTGTLSTQNSIFWPAS